MQKKLAFLMVLNKTILVFLSTEKTLLNKNRKQKFLIAQRIKFITQNI